MAKYLHKFETQTEFKTVYMSSAYTEPWTSYVVENSGVSYNKIIPSEAGDIVYYNGEALKYCKETNWSSSLGTPVAVVVVPASHTPDGTVRCISINGIKADGTSANTRQTTMAWGPTGNTGLPNLDKVPTWNNTIGGTISSDSNGMLSSNNSIVYFTGPTDCLDSRLKYGDTGGPFIPNPYLPDGSPNPDYRNVVEATTGNCLSDFNGVSNTALLVGLGTAYTAAYACHSYSTAGIPAGQWYLPAMGEFCYIMPRWEEISSTLYTVGGIQIPTGNFWSSSINDNEFAKILYTGGDKNTSSYRKTGGCFACPFCSLPGNLGF